MAAQQTILFTVMPRGVSVNSPSKPVSVFVSPRLQGAHDLGAFPDWLNWTRNLHASGLELEFHCGARTQTFAIDRAPLRPDLWEQLFNAETYVRSHETFDDYATRGLISFSVREALSTVKSIYQDASLSLALPDAGFGEGGRERGGNRNRLSGLVNGLQVHWDGRRARRLRHQMRDRASRASGIATTGAALDREGLIRAPLSDDARERESQLQNVATPFAVFHHMPTPEYRDGVQMPDRDKLLDFHQALTSLNSYPWLLRALGLVFDFDLPNEFISKTPPNTPGTISVRTATAGWRWRIQPHTHPLDTAYLNVAVGEQELFVAAPRSITKPGQPGTVLGLLDLDPQHFGLAQVDVDGAMHKAIMLAETLHPTAEHNRFPDGPAPAHHPDVFDPEATLPSLRSGGFSLFADDRALALLRAIQQSKNFNNALQNNQPLNAPFFAEDLVRGYRIDVWDSRTNEWHSLHLRHARYQVGDVAVDPAQDPEEGWVQLGATQAAPGAEASDRELYLHEAIARWAGWSLSIARPGKHLSRYADADRAIPKDGDPDYAEDQPETPFRIAAEYRVVRGSLPPLRFGVRYRFRARAVDLAGNSLLHDDKIAEALAQVFALPRDPEGFVCLRFEPVPAPLLIMRDEAVVTAPGSALDRLVIRTFNSDITLDGTPADTAAADRHIVPPRASIEMGERLSTFDDAAGKLKSDAATWKLIADRDAGEFHKKKIIIKGRKDDGSNEYPLEPDARIDALPYFPDPLARGAALRDLPGAVEGSIAKVAPDTGAGGEIEYNALSDPNPRPGSATLISFGETDNWAEIRGFRLALADPAPDQTDLRPSWNPTERVLTVYLPKGQTAVVPLSSYLHRGDLKLMGVWQWLREHIEHITGTNPSPAYLRRDSDRIAHVLQRAVEGGHWMLTPPHLLTLVHAAQQPIGRPEFTALAVHHKTDETDEEKKEALQTVPSRSESDPTELAAITAWRRFGSTETYLLGALRIHAASTAKIDLLAEWTDPVDDIHEKEWAVAHHTSHVEELPLHGRREPYLAAAGDENRSVGYYDLEHDQIAFVRAGDAPDRKEFVFYEDAAPRHVLNDTRHHMIRYTATVTSRYREYFDAGMKPSEFTRTSDAILVNVPASARPLAPEIAYVIPTFGWERQTETNLKRSVRYGGGLRVYLERPWFSSGEGELLGAALWSYANGSLTQGTRDKFKPFFTQWGMDPIWETAGLTSYPQPYHFADGEAIEYDLSLEEASARQHDGKPGRVSVVGFAPQYDTKTQLWFADLTINLPSETYMPFVRLALVRYQPNALADAKVSRVVLADFAQLTPDRSATVTTDPHHARAIRVTVSGVGPRAPKPIVQSAAFPKPSPSATATRIRVRVQKRDAAIASDLAWNDVGPEIAKVAATIDGHAPADVDLAMWLGTVTFTEKPAAGQFRLVIEEHEFISATYAEHEGNTAHAPSRLVYAEIFELDEALVGA
ncbi:MAG: hypothetical protein M3032_03955 [Verrucomicrobiota bacterium]|nr:hypothetical protein [Verrucomicrobiota bacterium]